MPKPMQRRLVLRKLKDNDCGLLRTGGGHDVYQCPCGKHTAPVPRHGEITAGVVGSIQKQMACLPKGWLQ